LDDKKRVKILYTNWRGETKVREIIPAEIVFVSTEWHPEEQWCLKAFDVEKKAERTFACKDIKALYTK
jgi:predicted DNA-binding transcriptional regulator YafY